MGLPPFSLLCVSNVPVVIQPGPDQWGPKVVHRVGVKAFNSEGTGSLRMGRSHACRIDCSCLEFQHSDSFPAFLGPSLFALILDLLLEFPANCFLFKILPSEKS